MALPVSQGGIDYQDGGFYSGHGGYPLVGDLAELAARLGAIHTYDRQGTIIWQTDFESGLQGAVLASDHADSIGIISATRSYHGAYSLKLDPRNADDSYVNWKRVIQFLETGRVGSEVTVSVDDDMRAVRLTMWHWDGSYELYAPMDYATEGGLWKIRDKDLGWVTVISGFNLQQGPGAWHTIKLVIDTEEETYVRLRVAKHDIDLTGYNLVKTASSALGQLETRVTIYGNSGNHAPAYIDGVIVTQNEP